MKTTQWQKIANFWQTLTSGSVDRQIFGAAITIGLGTIIVKVVSTVKELVVAWKFGTSDNLDAFLIAVMIPEFVINIIASSFKAALIPTYIKLREQEGIKESQKIFSGITVLSLGLLGITTVLMLVLAPFYLPIIAGGFSPEKLELTYYLSWVISPIILITGTANIWGAVFNAGEKFALVAVTPVITSAIIILFLCTINYWGIFNLPFGLICGQLLEMIVVGIALHRQGIALIPKWYGFNKHIQTVISQYIPTVASGFIMNSAVLVDQSMAAMLTSGSVATLNYANKIAATPITIICLAIGTAVIPYFSKMIAHNDWVLLSKTFKKYISLTFVVTVPISGLIMLFSKPIVQILFERGSFTAYNTHLVAQTLVCYAFEIPFFVGNILILRLISSMQNNQIIAWTSSISLILNISLNYLFMQWWGIAGIAFSTSCVYLFSFSFLLFWTLRNLKLITKKMSYSIE